MIHVNRRAFTMIELVFVIVIVGIIASIGANISGKILSTYTNSRGISELNVQTELLLDQIQMRFANRLKGSVKGVNSHNEIDKYDCSYDNSCEIVQWLGVASEAMLAQANDEKLKDYSDVNLLGFGWSGFVDNSSGETSDFNNPPNPFFLKTPNSQLSWASSVLIGLSGQENNSSPDALCFTCNKKPALFLGKGGVSSSDFWEDGDFAKVNIYEVKSGEDEVISIDTKDALVIKKTDEYKIINSAYALVPIKRSGHASVNADDYDLYLYYNYYPWLNEKLQDIKDDDNHRVLLAQHVSTYKVRLTNTNALHVKICIRDVTNGAREDEEDYAICKEKIIY